MDSRRRGSRRTRRGVPAVRSPAIAIFLPSLAGRVLRLLILGEGPQRPTQETLIRALGLGARVALSGFRANPFAYMARARLFVLSCAWEWLPGVLIQALAEERFDAARSRGATLPVDDELLQRCEVHQ